MSTEHNMCHSLLQLLLGSEVVAVTTLLLPAVHGSGVEPGVAHTTDHLVTVVLLSQDTQRWLNNTASQSQHQVKSGLLLDVVVRQSPSMKKLFSTHQSNYKGWAR